MVITTCVMFSLQYWLCCFYEKLIKNAINVFLQNKCYVYMFTFLLHIIVYKYIIYLIIIIFLWHI